MLPADETIINRPECSSALSCFILVFWRPSL